MNTSRLYLRENKSFEEFNIGLMGYVHYTHGTWHQEKDTITLNFTDSIPNFLSKKMLIKDNHLFKIHNNSLISTPMYLGDCRGLN